MNERYVTAVVLAGGGASAAARRLFSAYSKLKISSAAGRSIPPS
jgi:hypothetical protein